MFNSTRELEKSKKTTKKNLILPMAVDFRLRSNTGKMQSVKYFWYSDAHAVCPYGNVYCLAVLFFFNLAKQIDMTWNRIFKDIHGSIRPNLFSAYFTPWNTFLNRVYLQWKAGCWVQYALCSPIEIWTLVGWVLTNVGR